MTFSVDTEAAWSATEKMILRLENINQFFSLYWARYTLPPRKITICPLAEYFCHSFYHLRSYVFRKIHFEKVPHIFRNYAGGRNITRLEIINKHHNFNKLNISLGSHEDSTFHVESSLITTLVRNASDICSFGCTQHYSIIKSEVVKIWKLQTCDD